MWFFFKCESVKCNSIKYECLSCDKNYINKVDEELKKRFRNTSTFSNNDINKYILLLTKSVYPYKYMDDWQKFNETTLPKKEGLYNNVNIEDITDADYIH